MSTAIIYYTDNSIPEHLQTYCFINLVKVISHEHKIVLIDQKPRANRLLLNMFVNILCGVNQTDADFIFLAEHDVLYPEGYFKIRLGSEDESWDFQFTRTGYYLDQAGYYKRQGFPLSSILARRPPLIEFCRSKIKMLLNEQDIMWSEPTPDAWHIKTRDTENPYVDIRHGNNFTGMRNGKTILQTIPYWPPASELWAKLKEAK